MRTEFPTLAGPVDCPACGVSAESGLAVVTQGEYGTDLACEICSFMLFQSFVMDRGSELTPDDVIAQVGQRLPALAPDRAYLEPWDRRSGLALWWVSDPSEVTRPDVSPSNQTSTALDGRAVSSVTVRFVRPRLSSERVR